MSWQGFQRTLISGLVAGASAFGLAGGVPVAFAQTTETDNARKEQARALANSGADAFDAGDCPRTIELMNQAEALIHSVMHLHYIGRCHLKLGQRDEAARVLKSIADEPVAPDAHPDLRRVHQEARQSLGQLAKQWADEGVAAFERDDHAAALEAFRRSQAVNPDPSTQYNIALSQEALGQWLAAEATYEQLAESTTGDVQSRAAADLADLRKRIPTLQIDVEAPAGASFQVTRNGSSVSSQALGRPVPADPGVQRVEVSGPQLTCAPKEVTLAEKDAQAVTLSCSSSANSVAFQPTASEVDSGSSNANVWGWTAVGLGVAGVAVGTVLIIDGEAAFSQANDLAAVCRDDPDLPQCEGDFVEKGNELTDERNVKVSVGITSIAVGAGLGALGAYLLVSNDSAATSTEQVQVQPWIGIGWLGARGRF